MSLLAEVRAVVAPALDGLQDPAELLLAVKPAADPKNGDFQANMAMALGKKLGRSPKDIAAEIAAKVPTGGLVESAVVAGPGFINLRLSDAWLANRLHQVAADERLGVAPVAHPRTVVIDLSGPNVAKPLHVGHLRSTIIGDALVRLLRFLGHTVVGDNHLGDWGTQFGILLYGFKHHRDDAAFAADPVRELARLYIHVRGMFKKKDDEDDGAPTDDPVLNACRAETAKLHAGDPENVALWQKFMPACLEMLRPIYDRLDVKIDHALGESFYNPMLPGVVADLLVKGIAVESNGAVVVPNAKGVIPGPDDKNEEPPALVRKRDGAFTYTTTDFATIKHRAETWHPDAMLYVVDARQALHFKTLFANARRWGYDGVEFQHVPFGSILGPGKRPIKTRDGGVPELMDLLDDAVSVAGKKYHQSLDDRRASGREAPELSADEERLIAEAVGVGAVKYADLSQNRLSDYVFDVDKMTAAEGNTATYMQYAYARCRAIQRKAESPAGMIALGHPAERALGLQLLRFADALKAAAAELAPHQLTAYLWDTARALSGFYENCLVLTADTPEAKASRLALVELTARTIQTALGLLGIKTVERM